MVLKLNSLEPTRTDLKLTKLGETTSGKTLGWRSNFTDSMNNEKGKTTNNLRYISYER